MKLDHAPAHILLGNILRKLKTEKITVLDYGCGDGLFIDVIGLDNLIEYTGYDTSQNSIIKAKQNFQSNKISFSHIKSIPRLSANKYDVIMLIGVIQYVPQASLLPLLSSLKNALNKNGVLLISTTSDHLIYRLLDLYNLILPHNYFNNRGIVRLLNDSGFKKIITRERGLLLAPTFSNFVSPFIDAFDRIVLGYKGGLGPLGTSVRSFLRPVLFADFFSSKNFGYTLFVVATKD